MQESDIVYENGNFWVGKTRTAYEVYEIGLTHSKRRDIIGLSLPNALNRAKRRCDQRQQEAMEA